MEEIWKDIPNYKGIYKISNFGNIKSLERKIKNPIHGFITLKERVLKLNCNSKGYFCVGLRKDKKRKTYTVHKLVALTFLEYTGHEVGIVIDHIDNNPLNNKLDNLQLISQRENASKRKSIDSSKYTGVREYKRTNKWQSYINLIGSSKSLHLGYFKEEEEAYKQYKKALKYILENKLKEGDITAKELRNKLIKNN